MLYKVPLETLVGGQILNRMSPSTVWCVKIQMDHKRFKHFECWEGIANIVRSSISQPGKE